MLDFLKLAEDGFIPYVPLVRINSLKHKCLSKLVSILLPSNTEDPEIPSEPLEFKITLPIRVVQLLIDHIEIHSKDDVKKSVQPLCALLSNGGCYSFNLDELTDSKLSDQEVAKIVDVLSSNGEHLRRLSIRCISGFPFKENNFRRLQYIGCTITSLQDLLSIFSNCPNLTGLDIWTVNENWKSLTHQEVTTFYQKLLTYNQARLSLQKLSIKHQHINTSKAMSYWLQIKLLSLFPNLVRFKCNNFKEFCEAIYQYERLLKQGYSPESLSHEKAGSKIDENFNLRLTELRQMVNIFKQFKGLCIVGVDTISGILKFFPNLEDIKLQYSDYLHDLNLHEIVNFKSLNKLSLAFRRDDFLIQTDMILPVLMKIGPNLQYLCLKFFSNDVSVIGQYCPNLQHLTLTYPPEFFLDYSTENMSEEKGEIIKSSFTHLKSLSLCYCSHENIPTYILTNASNIEHIELNNCKISDENLTELLENNPLKNLQVLIIQGVHLISKNLCNKLTNPLEKLVCFKYTSLLA